jgi:uncharacterized membrane protein YedE/YeeE
MPYPELLLVGAIRVVVEVALLALLGQGVLAVLAGSRRRENVVYQLFATVTSPVVRMARFVTPKVVVDRHLPMVAFFILFWLWIGLAYVKLQICQQAGLVCT